MTTPEKRQQRADDIEAAFTVGKVAPDQSKIKDAFRQWAEPIIGFAIAGLYVAIILLFRANGEVRDGQEAAKERGFKNRSVACQTLIVDNDRSFPLTDDCTEPDVMKYYPAEVCAAMNATQADGCGTLFRPSPFLDPTGRD